MSRRIYEASTTSLEHAPRVNYFPTELPLPLNVVLAASLSYKGTRRFSWPISCSISPRVTEKIDALIGL